MRLDRVLLCEMEDLLGNMVSVLLRCKPKRIACVKYLRLVLLLDCVLCFMNVPFPSWFECNVAFLSPLMGGYIGILVKSYRELKLSFIWKELFLSRTFFVYMRHATLCVFFCQVISNGTVIDKLGRPCVLCVCIERER